ncbi:MAG TPA: hypothetical protein PKY99_13380 [Turneriella sp.]|nr:hypothetical protein [Turneriella sp.]
MKSTNAYAWALQFIVWTILLYVFLTGTGFGYVKRLSGHWAIQLAVTLGGLVFLSAVLYALSQRLFAAENGEKPIGFFRGVLFAVLDLLLDFFCIIGSTILIIGGLVLSLIGISDVACTGSSVTEKTVPMLIIGVVSLFLGIALRSDDSLEGYAGMKEKLDRDS